MRLILEYQAGSYTWWASETLPIEYESEEALLCDFEVALDKAIAEKKWGFDFLGHDFSVEYFYSAEHKLKTLPDITNLDQWFELNKKVKYD